jgi:hypothetical protein
MALWIILAGALVLALIIGSVLLVVLLATGHRTRGIQWRRLSRLAGHGDDDVPTDR